MNGAGLAENLSALDLVLRDTAEKKTYVVSCFCLIHLLVEHLNTGDNGGLSLLGETDDLNGVGNLNGTALNTSGSNGSASGDGEYVLDREEEGLVSLTSGSRNILVNSLHELLD